MTKTVANVANGYAAGPGGLKIVFKDVNVTGYTEAGEPLVAGDFGLGQILFVPPAVSDEGYVFKYDIAAGKLLAYMADYDATGDGALIAATTAADVGAARLMAIGW